MIYSLTMYNDAKLLYFSDCLVSVLQRVWKTWSGIYAMKMTHVTSASNSVLARLYRTTFYLSSSSMDKTRPYLMPASGINQNIRLELVNNMLIKIYNIRGTTKQFVKMPYYDWYNKPNIEIYYCHNGSIVLFNIGIRFTDSFRIFLGSWSTLLNLPCSASVKSPMTQCSDITFWKWLLIYKPVKRYGDLIMSKDMQLL